MERIFRFDELSSEKQRNVREAYARPNLGEIVFVIDDTAFRGCRDGLILTENFIATKEMFQEPNYYPLERLESIECINQKLILNGKVIYKFSLVEQDELDEFVAFLNDALQEDTGSENDGSVSVDNNENTDSRREIVADTDVAESTPSVLKEFIQLGETFHHTWTVLSGRTNDRKGRSQIIAQREFILEIMHLCAGWHDTLSREAQKLSEEENLFQYDLCCYLPALTYAAAHIAYLLQKEAGYNYDQTMRYVQFPFAIMKFISDKHQVKGGSNDSIAAVARKNNSPVLAECESRYQHFLSYLQKDILFGDSYVFFAADEPWAAHMDEDDDMMFFKRRSKAIKLTEADGFVEFVEGGLVIFENEIESALLAILQEYGPHNQVPHDLNLIKPSSIGINANTEGMRSRVRV